MRDAEPGTGGPPPRRKRELAKLASGAAGGVLHVHDAARILGVSSRTAALRLGDLTRSGWLARVRRGYYFVLPLEAPSAGQTTAEDPWVLASALYSPCYIAGWSAAEHWGLTEQIFSSTFVATAASIRARVSTYLGASFTLVRVRSERLKHLTSVWRGRSRVLVASAERTIVDGAIDPTWLGGARHLAAVLAAYVVSEKASWDLLADALEKSGTGAAARRLGFLVEQLRPDASAFVSRAYAARSSGVIKLDPNVRRRGEFNSKWRLWVNVALDHEKASTRASDRRARR